jgi:hypothetical protein
VLTLLISLTCLGSDSRAFTAASSVYSGTSLSNIGSCNVSVINGGVDVTSLSPDTLVAISLSDFTEERKNEDIGAPELLAGSILSPTRGGAVEDREPLFTIKGGVLFIAVLSSCCCDCNGCNCDDCCNCC